jgi:hypothetical protein
MIDKKEIINELERRDLLWVSVAEFGEYDEHFFSIRVNDFIR